MKQGDWVFSYSKGIWQIVAIDEIEQVFPTKSVSTTVHCKRFLNSSYKKSIAAEGCSPEFITPLPAEEMQKVNDIIKSHPKWYTEFLDFRKRIDSVLNLTFYVADDNANHKLKTLIASKFLNIADGVTDMEIVKFLKDELEANRQSSIRNFTVQFRSKNSEVEHNRLVYKAVSFLDF